MHADVSLIDVYYHYASKTYEFIYVLLQVHEAGGDMDALGDHMLHSKTVQKKFYNRSAASNNAIKVSKVIHKALSKYLVLIPCPNILHLLHRIILQPY